MSIAMNLHLLTLLTLTRIQVSLIIATLTLLLPITLFLQLLPLTSLNQQKSLNTLITTNQPLQKNITGILLPLHTSQLLQKRPPQLPLQQVKNLTITPQLRHLNMIISQEPPLMNMDSIQLMSTISIQDLTVNTEHAVEQ